MATTDYQTAVAVIAGTAMLYFYCKYQWYRMKALRRKATKRATHKERTAEEKSRFMAESKNGWGVIE